MATISIELGKSSSQRQREVYLLVRQGDSRRRIKTGVKLLETEYITNKGKIRIRSLLKARAVEKLKNDLENSLEVINQVSLGESEDAEHIALRLIKKQESKALDFFVFSEDWIERTNIKGAKNYKCMLNTLEKFNGSRKLLFQDIDVRFLKDFERYLEKRPRAQSLYLGEIRHLFREATIECNTDEETVIKNNPFQRYKTPKQVMKKGVRALSLEDFLKIANYHPDGKGRKLLAHDCFILSFCLMGMNAIDLFNVKKLENGILKYNRTKTKDRRSDNAYIEVRVHPFVKKLMTKWKGTNGYVFKFRSKYNRPDDFNHALNIGLKAIGDELHIPGLQFYQARHTFASLSRNMMKFSKSDVDEALNHVGNYEIADVYISKDFSIINENNYKLIDRVFDLEPTPMDSRAKAVPKKNNAIDGTTEKKKVV
jgi:integrase